MVLARNMKQTPSVTPQVVFCDEFKYTAIFLDYLLEDNKLWVWGLLDLWKIFPLTNNILIK